MTINVCGKPESLHRLTAVPILHGLMFFCFYLACGPLSLRCPRRAHRLGARGASFLPFG